MALELTKESQIMFIETGYSEACWRMHYAGLAMQAMVTAQSFRTPLNSLAEDSFQIADAMIQESKKVK